MAFQKVERSYHSTPNGWRLCTFEEAKNGLKTIITKKFLNKWDRVRLLDGWITGPGYNFEMRNDFRGCLGYMLLIQTDASGRAYDNVQLSERGKEVALFLCVDDWNYEVVFWLLNSWSNSEIMDVGDVKGGNVPFNNVNKFKKMNKLIGHVARRLGEEGGAALDKARKIIYSGRRNSVEEVLSGLFKFVKEEKNILQFIDVDTRKSISSVGDKYSLPDSVKTEDIPDSFWRLVCDNFACYVVEVCATRCLRDIRRMNTESTSQSNLMISTSILLHLSDFRRGILHEPLGHCCKGDCAAKLLKEAGEKAAGNPEKFYEMLNNIPMWSSCDDILDKLLFTVAKPKHNDIEGREKIAVVDMLLKCGARPGTKYAIGKYKNKTTLHSVAKYRDEDVGMEVAQTLFDKCDEETIYKLVKDADERGRTALHSASERGNARIAELLLEHDALLTAKDEKGMTALHYAFEGEIDTCKDMGTETARLLLGRCDERNIRDFVNSTDESGRTALHRSSEKGSAHICALLVDHGCSMTAQDNKGMTALHYAFEGGIDRAIGMGTEIAKVLLRICDKQSIYHFVNTRDERGRTAVHCASEKGNSRICQLLLEQGAVLTSQDNLGMTALHCAFEGGIDRVIGFGTEIVKVLLRMCKEANIRVFVNAVDINRRTALHGASEKGNAHICGLLIDRGASITIQDKEGMTALHYAFEGGFHKVINAGKQIVETFLNRTEGVLFEELSMRACIGTADNKGRTVLHMASEKADSHICEWFLNNGASVTAKDKSGQTALHCAFNGEIDRVIDVGIPIAEALLRRFDGQSYQSVREFVNATDENGRTALHRASENANAHICVKLAEHGASVTAQDKKHMTALHYAFEGGIDKDRDVASEIAEALLRKCDEQSIFGFVNVRDVNGRTALHVASNNGTAHACGLLIDRGALVNAQDINGMTALHCAFDGRSDRDAASEIAEALLGKCHGEQTINDFVNATDKKGKTALHAASLKGPAHICRLLVDRGAVLTARDKSGWTALHYALEVGVDKDIDTGTEIAKALLDKCEERNTYEFVNAADDRGWTALHGASEKGIAHLCELLLDCGASVTAQDMKGRTALHVAVKRKMAKVIDVLLKSSCVNFSLALRDDDGCTPVEVALANMDYVTTGKLLLKSEEAEAYLDTTLPNMDSESTAKLLLKCKKPEAYFSKVNQEQLLRNYLLLGSVDIVNKLLKKGIKLPAGDCDEDGKSAFHLAAMCDNESNAIEMTAFIIGRETPENVEKMVAVRDRRGRTALHAAALNGYKELCLGLLGFNSELIYIKDSEGRNPLYDAVIGEYKGRALYKNLLDAYLKKAMPHDNLVDRMGLTPLHVAASHGKAQAVKVLLSWDKIKTEYLSRGDNIAQTALHKAVKRGYFDIVEILLKHGAHPLRERDRDGRTALHYVVQAETQSKQKLAAEDKKTLADRLLGACKSDEEKTLLLWASAAGLGTADQYLDPGHPPDEVHKHLAAERKKLQKVNLLQIAVSHENIEMTKELISRGYQIGRTSDPASGVQLREANNETINRVLRQVKMIKEKGNDKPTISDSLGRLNYAQGLAALFLNPCIKPPIAVGITGSWGTGKSSLMLQTERILLTTAARMALLPSSKLPSSASELPGIKKCELSTIGKRKCEYIYRQIKRGERITRNIFVPLWDYIRGKVKQTSPVKIEEKMETLLDECEEKFINQNDLKYLTVFKALAAMDSSDMSAPEVDSSGGENSCCLHWQSSPKLDTSAEENMNGVLTVQYNAWRYRNDTEALAGLAVEITKELEGIMSKAQWLSTCWRNAWIKNKYSLWIEFFFPPLLALVLAGSLTWIAWVVFGSDKLKEWGNVKYAWPPAAFATILWALAKSAMGILKPVSSQLMQYMSFPNHTEKLGYQERVISDICFLKDEIGKKPFWVFNVIARLMTVFTALSDITSFLLHRRSHENAIQAPKLAPATGSNLRIIVFVDDLDRCSESVILQVLSAVNLVLAVCEINVVIGMDKRLIQRAIINNYGCVNVDKSLIAYEELADVYLQKIIQLPLDLPDPRHEESRNFLRGQLGVMDDENTAVTKDDGRSINGGRQRESVQQQNTPDQRITINMQPSLESADMRSAASGKEKPTSSILVREMLFVRYYSKGEEDAFLYFHELATDYRKHPREWKRLLNYHRLVWYIFSASKEANNLVGWQIQLITWIFICWEWQDNMTVVIKNWKEIGDIKLESPPSLLRIVEHLMNTGRTAYEDSQNANSGKLVNDELDKSLDELKTEIKKLKETVSDDLMKEITDLKKHIFSELKEDIKKGNEHTAITESGKKTETWNKKNWERMRSTLEKYDVSMDGIQAFQRFRFYCIAGYLPRLGKDTKDGGN